MIEWFCDNRFCRVSSFVANKDSKSLKSKESCPGCTSTSQSEVRE